jgi:hypothetical protein
MQGDAIVTAIKVFLLGILFLPQFVSADEKQAPTTAEQPPASAPVAVECVGGFYRSKLDGVPVYADAATTSQVLTKLALGAEVCYLGERAGFAIVEWPLRTVKIVPVPESEKVISDPKLKIAFVRTVDLWEPRGSARKRRTGLLSTLKDYYYYMRSGGVPDDGLAPYRPLLNSVSPSDTDVADCEPEAPCSNESPPQK